MKQRVSIYTQIPDGLNRELQGVADRWRLTKAVVMERLLERGLAAYKKDNLLFAPGESAPPPP